MNLTDELIDDYLSGNLEDRERLEFERELDSNPSARLRLDEERLVSEMLRASAPQAPSEAMWMVIKSRISQAEPKQASSSPWQRLAAAFAGPGMRLGLASACALLFLSMGWLVSRRIQPMPQVPSSSAALAIPAASKPALAALPHPRARQATEMASAAPTTARLAAANSPHQPTEVEKALAEQDLDGVIAAMLRERQVAASAPMRQSGASPVQTVAYSGAPATEGGLSAEALPEALPSPAHPVGEASMPLPQAQTRVDANGFWDFHPAAVALNMRDWGTASRELEAASESAPEAAERAFAASTLQLLVQGGQPVVAKVDMGDTKNLNVQSASRWQVLVDNHAARYFGGVVARMPGLRSEGNELLLDMAFDRATFSPGTKFIKLATDGGAGSQVKNAQGQPVDATEFRAPNGADYLLRVNELRLK
jgi:hypothetical protein